MAGLRRFNILFVDDKRSDISLFQSAIHRLLTGQTMIRRSISSVKSRTSSMDSRKSSNASDIPIETTFKEVAINTKPEAATSSGETLNLFESEICSFPRYAVTGGSKGPKVYVSKIYRTSAHEDGKAPEVVEVQCFVVNRGELAHHLLKTRQIPIPDATYMDENIDGSLAGYDKGHALTLKLISEELIRQVIYNSTTPTSITSKTQPFYDASEVHVPYHYSDLLFLHGNICTSPPPPRSEIQKTLKKLQTTLELAFGMMHPHADGQNKLLAEDAKSPISLYQSLRAVIAKALIMLDRGSEIDLRAIKDELNTLVRKLSTDCCKVSLFSGARPMLYRALGIDLHAPKPADEEEKTTAGAGVTEKTKPKCFEAYLPIARLEILAQERMQMAMVKATEEFAVEEAAAAERAASRSPFPPHPATSTATPTPTLATLTTLPFADLDPSSARDSPLTLHFPTTPPPATRQRSTPSQAPGDTAQASMQAPRPQLRGNTITSPAHSRDATSVSMPSQTPGNEAAPLPTDLKPATKWSCPAWCCWKSTRTRDASYASSTSADDSSHGVPKVG